MFSKYLIAVVFSSLFISTTAQAQTAKPKADTVWQNSMVAALNLQQISYKNWTAGGEDALSYTGLIDGKAVRDNSITNWENTYDLAYGQTRISDKGMRKTDDKIDLSSVLTYKINIYVNPYVAATLKSQFAAGYLYDDENNTKTQVSDFFDPAYVTQSIGFGYQPIPEFKTRLGGALREVFTSRFPQYADDSSTATVEKTRVQGGIESVSELEWPVDDNVLLKSKLEVFAPLETLDEMIVHSDNSIVAVVSKYVNVNFTLQLINERPVSPRTQMKEGLAIGLTYTVF